VSERVTRHSEKGWIWLSRAGSRVLESCPIIIIISTEVRQASVIVD
jgi:hypothetical protein